MVEWQDKPLFSFLSKIIFKGASPLGRSGLTRTATPINRKIWLYSFEKLIFKGTFFGDLNFWRGWLHYSTLEAENWIISVLLRNVKNVFSSFFFFKNLILKVFHLENIFWRATSSQPSLLAVFCLAIFGTCLCFEVLGRQLDHQSDCALAAFVIFFMKFWFSFKASHLRIVLKSFTLHLIVLNVWIIAYCNCTDHKSYIQRTRPCSYW